MHELEKPLVRVVPGSGIGGSVFEQLSGSADDLPDVRQAADFSLCPCLHEQVPQHGCFGWSGEHWAATGIGGELVQQRVVGSTADDMNCLDALATEFFELFENHPVFESETLESTTDERSFGIWWSLASLTAKTPEFADHVLGAEEPSVVRVDQCLQGPRLLGHACQFSKADRVAAAFERPLALLDQPEPHDVLSIPPSFVRLYFKAVAETTA